MDVCMGGIYHGFHDQVILQLQSLTHRQTKIDPTPSIQLLRGFPSHDYLISRFSSQVSYDHQELIKASHLYFTSASSNKGSIPHWSQKAEGNCNLTESENIHVYRL
ncbi:uncharacterized protein LOC117909719 [Vitis riparia]|uniref:uncharacterized protein LOC117909719 n=1 Tax=Vitis riparia TaxID=96939 RepID=UPI00155A1FC0|nr:uncharacterized protein LOC117909719 [Vitis riparia]